MQLHRASWQLAGAAALFAAAGNAQAIDYWRIDLGSSMSTDAGIRDKDFASDQAICGDAACTSAGTIKDVGNSYVISGGLGWKIGADWRADVTLAYRGGYKVDETMPDATNVNADITSISLMAAGYRDFTLSWGKPYVGAGIGFAQNEAKDVKFNVGGFSLDAPGGTKSGLAWSLMAGVGFQLSPTMTLDVGYRYTDLGKIETGSGNINFGGVPVTTYSGAEGKLRANEISIGLRF